MGSAFFMFSMFSVVFGRAVSRFRSRIAYTGVLSAGKAWMASAAAGSHGAVLVEASASFKLKQGFSLTIRFSINRTHDALTVRPMAILCPFLILCRNLFMQLLQVCQSPSVQARTVFLFWYEKTL